jgi:predicted AAA+ superfamily ATPase
MLLDELFVRLESLVTRIESRLPEPITVVDWQARAFRWRVRADGTGFLQAIKHPQQIACDTLKNIDHQKQAVLRNTQQFISGFPANNILLTGARGTGKSTLIKACWCEFSAVDLKILEVNKSDLLHLVDIVELIADRPEKFIVFCDDLSFEDGELGYKTLKSVLDGSICAPSANMLFYATSNRRHLLAQTMRDNLDVSNEAGEIRPNDAIEEKVSLSERFGLWLSFYPFSQDEYLACAELWVTKLGGTWNTSAAQAALLWHRTRGARSGRIAWQFAKDYVGRRQ